MISRGSLRSNSEETFFQKVSLCRIQRTLLDNVPNCFHLITLATMISLVNTPRLDMHLQNAMTYAKLKGRT